MRIASNLALTPAGRRVEARIPPGSRSLVDDAVPVLTHGVQTTCGVY
jgi:hypothetical protein